MQQNTSFSSMLLAIGICLSASSSWSNSATNAFVVCSGDGVCIANATDFHVSNSNEPVILEFSARPGWILVSPKTIKLNSGSQSKAMYKVVSEETECWATGTTSHCFFSKKEDLGHDSDPTISIEVIEAFSCTEYGNPRWHISGACHVDVFPAYHHYSVVYSDCPCGEQPNPRTENKSFPVNLLDTFEWVVSYKNHKIIYKKTYPQAMDEQDERIDTGVPWQDPNKPTSLMIFCNASSTKCADCKASQSMETPVEG